MPIDLRFAPDEAPLLTDLYELTMAASYFALGLNQPSCFYLGVRRMPPKRGFLVAAGIDRVVEALEQFHFAPEALEYLESLKLFAPEFLGFLANLRFTGDVHAVAEGTIFFEQEPILEVHAPLIEAQIIETLVLNQIGVASMVASKAARCVVAARGRRLVDFGLRRSHGADAGLIVARASYLAGFVGTSNVLAGRRYGIPLNGTMAHSYIMAHDSEREAFDHFITLFPQLSTLLVDTYDTVRGVENAARVARDLKAKGLKLQAIRLDSGDLIDLSLRARRILDQNGLNDVAIFASGNLDEYRINDLLRAGAPIDGFGIGAAVAAGGDVPTLDASYKLAEYHGIGRLKTSPGKATLPGRKQVFRALDASGGFTADLIGLADEGVTTVANEFKPAPVEVAALLTRQMAAGVRVEPRLSLAESRNRLLQALASLGQRHKDLERPAVYPVRHTAALNAMLTSEKIRSEKRQS
jgi:nicotinate phosphoribosyltransferase